MGEMYVEVLLPLPLYSTFTYSVAEDMRHEVETGSRVLVQFGRKKYYTGIVVAIHSVKPDYKVKPVMAIMDKKPVVRYPQLKFWNWIADYYLCSPGEVFKAAIPTGLKPESETYLTVNPDYEPDQEDPFRPNERQTMVLMMFQEAKRLKIADIESRTGIKNVAALINPLIQKNIIEIDERLAEKYRPKKKTFVELACERSDSESLHKFMDMVKRSPMKEKTLLTYLDLSGWFNHSLEIIPVEKQALMDNAEVGPAIIRGMADKGILKIVKKNINRFAPDAEKISDIRLSKLSGPQAEAFGQIEHGFKEKNIQLLHGVTGSGKTEIYAHLIARTIEAGNQVLFLVPEISLTTQLSDRLHRIFGNRLLVYHSKFSDSERVDIWNRLLTSNEPLVVLGVRSSVFLPFSRLGLVIIDEEHEASFKQYDPAPRYNARDTALVLASMHGAKSLLGSATPAIETYYKALTGKYGLVTLSERFEGAQLPDVEVINMKEMKKKKAVKGILSSPLRDRLLHTVKEGKQSILFQNRRGFAPMVICEQCGWVPKCRDCDVSMVYHKTLNILKCHYCGYTYTLPPLCPACGSNSLNTFGYGTERIADEIQELFPESKVVRMDLDTTRNKDAYQGIIEDFANHKTDILVGTQMVSKGLDFGDVQTVGVVNADTLLNFPDFRSNERAFNMLEQVAGRAGRRKEKGTVMIQTYNSGHEVLKDVKNHDYDTFYRREIESRSRFAYPPFTKIINIYIKNKDSELSTKGAVAFALALRNVFNERVLGPEKPFVSRVAGLYIQTIMLKIEAGASMKKVKDLLRQIYASVAALPELKSSIIYYDVDPV